MEDDIDRFGETSVRYLHLQMHSNPFDPPFMVTFNQNASMSFKRQAIYVNALNDAKLFD